ncbi:MAG: sensor histidine kinase [Clostridiales bacterium]|nr:sensor histidine kinase [Clostridiales bacterium]
MSMGKYLKQRRKWLLLLACCVLVFAVSFLLYHLPLAAVLYPSALCAALVLGWFLADYRKQREKKKRLTHLAALPDDLTERLEEAPGSLEEAYETIIRNLSRREQDFRREQQRREADRADYYTTWVHQIKTPIASMYLSLENEDSPLSRSLGEELQRIEQYVQMVLTYQRLDSVDTDYVFRECPMDPLVKGALRKFAAQFIRKGIRLDYTPTQKSVVTDEKWLSFVVEQLLSNALKYTPQGTVSIYLEDGSLCIRDTGIGIAPEDLPRIFERGYTGCNGRSDKKASGLGLYLCRRICNNLGHNLTAESTPGVGTLMKLDLNQTRGRFE